MEPEYYQLYKDLSVPELVKVAKSPWDYMPEAVTAAQRILHERGISMEEIAAEEWNLAQKEMLDAATKRRFADYFDWVGEIFRVERSMGPAEKWFGVFLLFYALYYTYDLFQGVRLVVFYLRCKECYSMVTAVYYEVFFEVYATLALLFVLKQKRLGWVLLNIQVITLNCVMLSKCLHAYMHHAYLGGLTIIYLLPFIANTAILLFLFRPYIVELFGVDKKVRDYTLLGALGLGVVGMVFL